MKFLNSIPSRKIHSPGHHQYSLYRNHNFLIEWSEKYTATFGAYHKGFVHLTLRLARWKQRRRIFGAIVCQSHRSSPLFLLFTPRAHQPSSFPSERDLVWKISLRRDGVLNVTQCSPNVVVKTGNAGDETAICACHNFRAVLLPKAFDNARPLLSAFLSHTRSPSLYSVQISCRPHPRASAFIHAQPNLLFRTFHI